MQRLILLIAGLILATSGRAQSKAGVIVTMKTPTSEFRGSRLLLGDIAKIDVFAGKRRSAGLRARLARVELGRWSKDSSVLTVERKLVRRSLIDAGVDAKVLEIDGPERVQAVQKRVRIDARRAERAIRRHIEGVLGSRAKDSEIRFVGTFRPFDAPVGRFRFALDVEEDTRNRTMAGRLDLSLIVKADGVVQRRVIVPVIVRRPVEVVRMARRVAKGRVLAPEDLELTTVVMDGNNQGLFHDIMEAVGRKTLRHLERGMLLSDTSIEGLPAIHKGDIVTARVRIGGLVAQAVCQASQDGAIGQRIALINMGSKKTVYGIVVSPRIVEVAVGQQGGSRP